MTRWLTATVAALVLVGATNPALADGTADIEGLLDQPIVVTASKTAESQSAAPGTATVLTSDDLRRYGIHTIAEAIDFLSLGAFTSTSPQGSEVGVRGVLLTSTGNDDILLLVNGHAVNEPLSGGSSFDRSAGIPIEIVDHIEVILGPGSVLYGTGAMLGVVNVVTKSASVFHGVHVVVEASPLTSVRLGAGAGYEFGLLGAPSELTTAVEYFARSGPDLALPVRPFDRGQPTWGGVASQANHSEVASGILRFTTGHFELNLRGVVSRLENPVALLWFDNPLNRTIQRSGSIDIAYRIPVSSMVEITTRAYADTAESQLHQVAGKFFGCPAGFCDFTIPSVAHWAGAEVRSSFDWLGNARLVSMVGVDARIRNVASKFDHVDPVTGAPLEDTVSNFEKTDAPVGAYAQQTWQPASWLGFNGGLRLDADPRFPAVLSPRLAVAVNPWAGGAVKAIYSEAFRAPSFLETNSSAPAQFVADETVDGMFGKLHLDPEKVRMFELSIDQALGAQRLRMGGFVYDWNNLVGLHPFTDQELRTATTPNANGVVPLGDIPYSPTQYITQYRNVRSVRNYGFNLGFDGAQLDGALRYAVNVTAAIARDSDDRALTVAPQLFGNARVSYDFGGDLPTLAVAARAQGRRIVDKGFTGGFTPTPSTTPVLELRGTVAGPVPRVKGLSYRATADYELQSFEPYAVGTVQSTQDSPQPDLYPNPRGAFETTLGLQFDF